MPRPRATLYFLHEGWRQLVRDRALSGTAILANLATFFVSALFLLIAFNLDHGLQSIRARREVQAFLNPGSDPAQWTEVGTRLRSIVGVADAILITPEAALAEFEQEFGESGLMEALGANPLPASFRLRLSADHLSPAAIERIGAAASGVAGVESVGFGGAALANVEARIRIFAIVNLLVGILAGLCAAFIVANTIRLTILARRDLVAILKLIGARDGFVRWPFLVEGALQGIIAGTGALAVLWGLHAALSARLPGTQFFPPKVALLFLGAAALLGVTGAFASTEGPLRSHWRRT